MLKIGCCGFAGARARYWGRFPVVEVQKTFYQPPKPETLARWHDEAPEGFEFTLKAWQPVTHAASSPTWRRLRTAPGPPEEAGHFRPTGTVHAAWDATREAARSLGATWAVFQCPARFTPTDEHIADMRRFLGECEREGLRFAWEPRGDWPEDLVADLCAELDLVHAVDPMKQAPVTGGTAYFRLHGVTGYRYRHTEDDLRRLLDVTAGFDEAYCLFNNMTMREDAEAFRDLARGEGWEAP